MRRALREARMRFSSMRIPAPQFWMNAQANTIKWNASYNMPELAGALPRSVAKQRCGTNQHIPP
jgi:hypothetical protein